jgi:hypothetical protein
MYSGESAVPTMVRRSSLPFISTCARAPSLRCRASRKRWFNTASPATPGAGQRPLFNVNRLIAGGRAKSTPIRRAIIGGTTPSIES